MPAPSSPPFIQIENVHNIRALLISPAASPILYRSASISKITPPGLATLHALGVRTIFDLRSKREFGTSDPASEIGPLQRLHVPVFEDTDYSPEALTHRFGLYASGDGTAGYVKAYTEMLDGGGPAFRRIFEFLRDAPEGEKCLVHCTAGKDRTGVLCALVLLLAGCTDEVVAEEYALTEIGLAGQQEELVERLMKMEALKGDRVGAERMIRAKRENMLATVEVIRERYGGVEGYLRGNCGFEEGDIRVIKSRIASVGGEH